MSLIVLKGLHLVAKPNFIVLFLLEALCILVFLAQILFSLILKYFLIQGSVLSEGAKGIAPRHLSRESLNSPLGREIKKNNQIKYSLQDMVIRNLYGFLSLSFIIFWGNGDL